MKHAHRTKINDQLKHKQKFRNQEIKEEKKTKRSAKTKHLINTARRIYCVCTLFSHVTLFLLVYCCDNCVLMMMMIVRSTSAAATTTATFLLFHFGCPILTRLQRQMSFLFEKKEKTEK